MTHSQKRKARKRIAGDRRDKTNWAHGKMKRAGIFATKERT